MGEVYRARDTRLERTLSGQHDIIAIKKEMGAMSQLIVRNLDEELVRQLKVRAARRGRSAEAEHREILREALKARGTGKTFKQTLLEMPAVGEDSDLTRPRDLGRRTRL